MKRCDFLRQSLWSHQPPAFSETILPEALQGELPRRSGTEDGVQQTPMGTPCSVQALQVL
jgi:hypothetical protein